MARKIPSDWETHLPLGEAGAQHLEHYKEHGHPAALVSIADRLQESDHPIGVYAAHALTHPDAVVHHMPQGTTDLDRVEDYEPHANLGIGAKDHTRNSRDAGDQGVVLHFIHPQAGVHVRAWAPINEADLDAIVTHFARGLAPEQRERIKATILPRLAAPSVKLARKTDESRSAYADRVEAGPLGPNAEEPRAARMKAIKAKADAVEAKASARDLKGRTKTRMASGVARAVATLRSLFGIRTPTAEVSRRKEEARAAKTLKTAYGVTADPSAPRMPKPKPERHNPDLDSAFADAPPPVASVHPARLAQHLQLLHAGTSGALQGAVTRLAQGDYSAADDIHQHLLSHGGAGIKTAAAADLLKAYNWHSVARNLGGDDRLRALLSKHEKGLDAVVGNLLSRGEKHSAWARLEDLHGGTGLRDALLRLRDEADDKRFMATPDAHVDRSNADLDAAFGDMLPARPTGRRETHQSYHGMIDTAKHARLSRFGEAEWAEGYHRHLPAVILADKLEENDWHHDQDTLDRLRAPVRGVRFVHAVRHPESGKIIAWQDRSPRLLTSPHEVPQAWVEPGGTHVEHGPGGIAVVLPRRRRRLTPASRAAMEGIVPGVTGHLSPGLDFGYRVEHVETPEGAPWPPDKRYWWHSSAVAAAKAIAWPVKVPKKLSRRQGLFGLIAPDGTWHPVAGRYMHSETARTLGFPDAAGALAAGYMHVASHGFGETSVHGHNPQGEYTGMQMLTLKKYAREHGADEASVHKIVGDQHREFPVKLARLISLDADTKPMLKSFTAKKHVNYAPLAALLDHLQERYQNHAWLPIAAHVLLHPETEYVQRDRGTRTGANNVRYAVGHAEDGSPVHTLTFSTRGKTHDFRLPVASKADFREALAAGNHPDYLPYPREDSYRIDHLPETARDAPDAKLGMTHVAGAVGRALGAALGHAVGADVGFEGADVLGAAAGAAGGARLFGPGVHAAYQKLKALVARKKAGVAPPSPKVAKLMEDAENLIKLREGHEEVAPVPSRSKDGLRTALRLHGYPERLAEDHDLATAWHHNVQPDVETALAAKSPLAIRHAVAKGMAALKQHGYLGKPPEKQAAPAAAPEAEPRFVSGDLFGHLTPPPDATPPAPAPKPKTTRKKKAKRPDTPSLFDDME